MCIIAIKPAGVKINWTRMEDCFDANPDGAGIAYHTSGNRIAISKGYMTFKTFKAAVKRIGINKRHEAMFHFRIATHGAINETNCHPFPLSAQEEELQALDVTTDVAIMHNGIVPDMAKSETLSDTMLFIRDYLAPMGAATIVSPASHPLIGQAAASKLAIMDASGIATIGKFHTDKGWIYSNESYKHTSWATSWKLPKSWKQTKPAPKYLGGYTNGIAQEDAPDDDHMQWAYCDICNAEFEIDATRTFETFEDVLCDQCAEWLATLDDDETEIAEEATS